MFSKSIYFLWNLNVVRYELFESTCQTESKYRKLQMTDKREMWLLYIFPHFHALLIKISRWFTPRTNDFCSTKWLGRYQVQASRYMAQAIVLIIINALISNDLKKSVYILSHSKQRNILKRFRVNVSFEAAIYLQLITMTKVAHILMIIKLI